MKIIGINTSSRACVYEVLSRSENGSVFVFCGAIITRLGLLFLVEHNNKLAFYSLDEVVEEVLEKLWNE